MSTLVTGAAGFIGYHLTQRLLARGDSVVGLDNMNDYYDVRLKESRLARLRRHASFAFVQADLTDEAALGGLFARHAPTRIVHLAAQAGVRYSLERPHVYVESNVAGFLAVLEAARHHGCEHLVLASSSSVYGLNRHAPSSVHDGVDHPVSLYAATKRANELMAHSYSHLFGLPVTGLRFFTVFGPWGRPDMAPSRFIGAILEGRPIDVYNHGRMRRDFTYVDDIVEGTVRVLDRPPAPDAAWDAEAADPATSSAPFRLYNIGSHAPTDLLDFIAAVERHTGQRARMNMMPMQPGDVESSFADVSDLHARIGPLAMTPLDEAVRRTVAWYREFHQV